MPATLDTSLRQGTDALGAALNLDPRESRLDAQILLCHALQQPRSWLAAHDRDPFLPEQAAAFSALLQRRLQGEPIAYILGEREFYSLAFKVTPAVLIPRPETELLVELALERLPADDSVRVLDLGTGSGAVAVTLALHRPLAKVIAVDQSSTALEVARENSQRLGAGNLSLIQSDWYSALNGEKFNLIVSNPPYIAAADPHLTQGDVRFEPASALASGEDGLDDIRTIIQGATAHLKSNGWLLFEHGYDQAAACRKLLAQAGFKQVTSCADLAGIERVSYGLWAS
ncbi:protein-(glutamine-N5) methyltransferase, release factor-specific [Sulfuricella denitrificans skB26]|uniref:Release factor glutamine methyltransferase n=1 Tax=Sulfuricella denitrificans (strain DSM 22764 / NBRC 105220 / skB26) TaxID=1163617 RepID=S6A9L4_SULDS|nr:peptide chain release factor N(5)-glutamine methyltransferase [Sulfuricella denitrificans]BAN34315.1 protein-(glutamine-N5) methyltransferase, release factor-specific [Sulfuricella denitrificans skB26]